MPTLKRSASMDSIARAFSQPSPLDQVDLAPILDWIGDSRATLLCVERDPEACHRSLVAARLRDEFGFEVEDLRP